MKELICYCKNVTKAEIEQAIVNGAKSLKDIQKDTGASTGNKCKELNPSGICCSGDINDLLNGTSQNNNDCCCCK